jgi:two-component system, NarL family, sensor histidine kinase UhpB
MVGPMPLFWRVFVVNAAVLVAATLALALSPATVSPSLLLTEALVLAVGVTVVLVVNLVVMRRVFQPLERLARLMRRVDPLRPGQRITVDRSVAEVAELTRSFNDMLERLEHERRDSGRRTVAAQEDERRRLALELHDEIGQSLTGVVLQLESLSRLAPEPLVPLVHEVQESARATVEDVREIARGLRPDLLDTLGLRAALVALSTSFAERTGLHIERRLDGNLPSLAHEDEIAVYRIAQESLTNVARHAAATRVQLTLSQANRCVVLRVRDNGLGFDPDRTEPGTGLRGMRERALLAGGQLEIAPIRPRGTEVRLEIPAQSIG